MTQMARALRQNLDRVIAIRKQLIFSRPVGPTDPEPPRLPIDPPLTFIYPLDPLTLDRLRFEGGEAEREGVRAYLASGDQLAVIAEGDVVACRGLVRSEGTMLLEGHRRFRRLQNGQAFIHYCRTAENYRGRSLYPAMLAGILRELKASSPVHIHTAIISCRDDNIPSIKGIQRAGFTLRERTSTVGLLGGRFAWTSCTPAGTEGGQQDERSSQQGAS